MAKCVVSYLDLSGIRHQVEVEATSMYEAAALAIRAFREHDCEPSQLNGGAKTPKDVVIKDRLRELIQ